MENTNNEEEEISVRRLEGNEISDKDDFITYKIIIVGNSGVGKSCFLKRAAQKKFTGSYQATIGFEFLLMYYEVNGTKFKLQIWDTCGQEMYRSLIQGFYRNTALTVLVYAVDDKKSFDDLEIWIKDLKLNSSPDIKIFLIGNKNDLENERVITKQMGEKFKEEYELDLFMETSAKTGYNAQELFIEAAKILYKDYNEYKKSKKHKDNENGNNDENSIGLSENGSKKKKKCC